MSVTVNTGSRSLEGAEDTGNTHLSFSIVLLKFEVKVRCFISVSTDEHIKAAHALYDGMSFIEINFLY